MASFGPLFEVPIEEIKAVYYILSVLRVSRAVLPHMANRKSGPIINISSVVGEIPTPWAGVYASSKAAVHSISEAAAAVYASSAAECTTAHTTVFAAAGTLEPPLHTSSPPPGPIVATAFINPCTQALRQHVLPHTTVFAAAGTPEPPPPYMWKLLTAP
ncbi:hypothetical protein GGX14DRAFT_577857 [Mycena pura]|uniref:Uncharacterized protein n=1 Tax=Mycena pura TaxID=153505 RepID=A0AAD6XYH5_9AGAR|nr:hypothetical protein GGX14DRAFT_577857 [Mycena pura]